MRRFVAVTALAMALLFAVGCARSGAGGNFTHVMEDWQPTAPARAPQPAELDAYDTPAFGASLGFDVVSWPDSESLRLDRCFAIDKVYGQLVYSDDEGRILVQWVARQGVANLARWYPEAHNEREETRRIGEIDVLVQTAPEGCTMVSWQRGAFQYLMHCHYNRPAPTKEQIELLVKELDSAESSESAP